MATDSLSPPGSSTYSSDTMYVGDGTWDSTKNTFLLPNLMGLNFETMQYNGMGNRFSTLPQYHQLIEAHGIIAAITFLGIVPLSVLLARFYAARPGMAIRWHIWLQILTLFLSTVVFMLGYFAVGPARSLTNPHHGIGLAIYVLVIFQMLSGWLIHRRDRSRRRHVSLRAMLHNWIGSATALLGIAQVPMGLTLYGSPKVLFILYAVWMAFLLFYFFILSYRAQVPLTNIEYESGRTNTVISDKKPSRTHGLGGPLAAGLGLAALTKLARGRSHSRNRSRSRSRSRRGSQGEFLHSRRGSASYIDEKHERKESGGAMNTLLKAGAIFGIGALGKSWWDSRKRKQEDDDYSSVSTQTPPRDRRDRHRFAAPTEYSEATEVTRLERAHPTGPLLPGPGNAAAAAAAISAAEGGGRPARPTTPRTPRRGSRVRSDSYDSDFSSYYYDSPSRRPSESHAARNTVLTGLGLGWLAKKYKDRQDKNKQRREGDERARIEEERRRTEAARRSGRERAKFTGDGTPSRQQRRSEKKSELSSLSSEHTSDYESRVEGASGLMPPLPAGMMPGAPPSRPPMTSRQDITAPISMPAAPPDPAGIFHHDSASDSLVSTNIPPPPRRTSRSRSRRGDGSVPPAAVGAIVASEAEQPMTVESSQSPTRVKMNVKRESVTFRRVNESPGSDRDSRYQRHRHGDSISSLSGTDHAANRRRQRRQRAEASPAPGVGMAPLTPPNPAFAAGSSRRPKDSAYYSGQPAVASQVALNPSSLGSDGHGTWSGMSPGSGGEEDAAERRRRRRLERNQRPAGTVDFT